MEKLNFRSFNVVGHGMIIESEVFWLVYNFYGDMKYAKKKDSIKAYIVQQVKEKEIQECQKKLDEIEQKIHDIEVQLDQYQEISLLGVEVTQTKFGKGVVVK